MTYTEFVTKSLKWPALLPKKIVDEDSGYQIRELCTALELERMGDNLSNCTPTALEWCIKPSNSLHILQLENARGKTLAVSNFTEVSCTKPNCHPLKWGWLLGPANSKIDCPILENLNHKAAFTMERVATPKFRDRNRRTRTKIWEKYKDALQNLTEEDYGAYNTYRSAMVQYSYGKSRYQTLPARGVPPSSEWPVEEVKRMRPELGIVLI